MEHRGATFRFPGDWAVERRPPAIRASRANGAERVAVATFPLRRPYRPHLWDEAVAEVEVVARNLASRLSVATRLSPGRTIVIGARRARVFDIAYRRGERSLVERVGFLFAGRLEFQLACTIDAAEEERGENACDELFASFEV